MHSSKLAFDRGPDADPKTRGVGLGVVLTVLATVIPFTSLLQARAETPADVVPQPAPGSVVRWPGFELERCRLGDASWAPMDGACWYPIDLLHSDDEIRYVFLVLSPQDQPKVHLQALSELSRFIMDESNRRHLEKASDDKSLIEVFFTER